MAPPGHARRLLLAATVCAAAALALSPGAHAQFPNLWGPAPPPPDPWAPENRGSTPSGSGTANSNCPTVWQVLQSQPNLESTRTSLASAGLVAALNDSSFAGTLLAPVDQVMTAMGRGALKSLEVDACQGGRVLTGRATFTLHPHAGLGNHAAVVVEPAVRAHGAGLPRAARHGVDDRQPGRQDAADGRPPHHWVRAGCPLRGRGDRASLRFATRVQLTHRWLFLPLRRTLTFNWQWVPTGWASGSWVVGIQGATNTANIVTSNLAACNQVRRPCSTRHQSTRPQRLRPQRSLLAPILVPLRTPPGRQHASLPPGHGPDHQQRAASGGDARRLPSAASAAAAQPGRVAQRLRHGVRRAGGHALAQPAQAVRRPGRLFWQPHAGGAAQQPTDAGHAAGAQQPGEVPVARLVGGRAAE